VGAGEATVTVLLNFPIAVGKVRITVGQPIKLESYPSAVVRILTVVVVVAA
jgi:hypothetical protein